MDEMSFALQLGRRGHVLCPQNSTGTEARTRCYLKQVSIRKIWIGKFSMAACSLIDRNTRACVYRLVVCKACQDLP